MERPAQDLDANGKLIKDIFTGGLITGTQVYSSWENDYANGDGVLTGQKFYQSDITGQDYNGYVVELDATGKKIAETFTGVTNQPYSAYEYDLTSTGAVALEVYNMNDGSRRIIGHDSHQTINSIFNDLTTGRGHDSFVYTPFFGQATITDFNSTDGDTISLPTSEFADYAYVQTHNAVVDGNIVITGTNGDTLTLQHLTVLPGQSDFHFASFVV